MKQVKILSGIFALLVSVSSASASSVKNLRNYDRVGSYAAQLIAVDMDAQLPFAEQVLSGAVAADFSRGTLGLQLFEKKLCPAGMFCTLEAATARNTQMQILKVEEDQCGVLVLEAETVTQEGAVEKVILTDYRHDKCWQVRTSSSPVEVVYETLEQISGVRVQTTSYLSSSDALIEISRY